MPTLRNIVVSVRLACLFCAWLSFGQDVTQENSKQPDVKLVTIGNGRTRGGTPTAFRIYETPDGTKGQVVYTEFDSLPAAQAQIEEWASAAWKVTSRKNNQTIDGQVTSDRIVAIGELPKSTKEEFAIIRRDGLKCYFIESVSLQVAKKIEALIEHK